MEKAVSLSNVLVNEIVKSMVTLRILFRYHRVDLLDCVFYPTWQISCEVMTFTLDFD
jgi:hypothetical protein